MNKKKLPLLQVGLLLVLWGLYMSSGSVGLNIETGLVVLGSIIYLSTVLREAASH